MTYNKKVDLSNYYTKSETDNAISSHITNLSEYYTKTEIDNLLSQYAKSTSVPDMSNYLKKNTAYHLYDYTNNKEICIESTGTSGIGYLSNRDKGSAVYYTAFYLK